MIKFAMMLVVAFAAGIGTGVYVKGRTIDYALEHATTQALEKNLAVLREVQAKDQEQAVKDAARIAELEQEANELKAVIRHQPNLSAADVERVRKYFAQSAGSKARKGTNRR